MRLGDRVALVTGGGNGMGRAYCERLAAEGVAAKAGVIGLTRALARELGEAGIRVNAVAPGYTLTERSKRLMDEDALAQVLRRQTLKRPGAPEDPAGAVVFLASPESDFMTGQTLCVDGGWVAR